MEQWLSQKNHVIPAETCLTVVAMGKNSSGELEYSHGSTDIIPHVSSSKPWMLAIGSRALLHEIGEITGHKMSYKCNVFLRPFKLLAFHQSKFQARLAELQSECDSEENFPADSPTIILEHKPEDGDKAAGATESSAPSASMSSAAPDDLETQSRYHDKSLVPKPDTGPKLELAKLHRVRKLRDELSCLIEAETTASFDELWNLLRPGVLVASRKTPTQAYCVVRATGGQPVLTFSDKRKSRSSASSFPTGYEGTSLVVDCFRIDCDGSSFGPVAERFALQYFEGRRDVTSLDIYPLAAKGSSSVERLQSRGKMFVSMVQTPGKGFWYTGSMFSANEPYEDSYKAGYLFLCPHGKDCKCHLS
jgi:hypothetical protein